MNGETIQLACRCGALFLNTGASVSIAGFLRAARDEGWQEIEANRALVATGPNGILISINGICGGCVRCQKGSAT